VKISVRDLSFGYAGSPLFEKLSVDLESGEAGRPTVILGPSGCGKTTLLKLLGGLLKPKGGEIRFSGAGTTGPVEGTAGGTEGEPGRTAFMFQESRLLPWLTVLENIALPLEKDFGREEARKRARYFLSLVFLEDKEYAYPGELSGGQAQRVSMARAFAWPAPALFMDEPFQSLDIPLRISMMDLCLSLSEKEIFSTNDYSNDRLLLAVTHDPQEALYMGGRIIILGGPAKGIVYDKKVDLLPEERVYGSAAAGELEREMIQQLTVNS